MRVTLIGIWMPVRLVQPLKALLFISVTLEGISIFVSLMHISNNRSSIIFIPLGKFIFDKFLQSENALGSSSLMLAGSENSIMLLQPKKASLPIFVTLSGILTPVSFVQFLKSPLLICVIADERRILFNLSQLEKASLPIKVTEFGMSISLN